MRPKVSWVIRSLLLACNGEGLARVSSNDAIHFFTPRVAVKGFTIRPYRRLIQSLVFHPRYQDFDGECLDFNITDCSSRRNCQSEAEVKSSNTCTEGYDVEGKIHKLVCPRIEWFDYSKYITHGVLVNLVLVSKDKTEETSFHIGVIHTVVDHRLRLVFVLDRYGHSLAVFFHFFLHFRAFAANVAFFRIAALRDFFALAIHSLVTPAKP